MPRGQLGAPSRSLLPFFCCSTAQWTFLGFFFFKAQHFLNAGNLMFSIFAPLFLFKDKNNRTIIDKILSVFLSSPMPFPSCPEATIHVLTYVLFVTGIHTCVVLNLHARYHTTRILKRTFSSSNLCLLSSSHVGLFLTIEFDDILSSYLYLCIHFSTGRHFVSNVFTTTSKAVRKFPAFVS